MTSNAANMSTDCVQAHHLLLTLIGGKFPSHVLGSDIAMKPKAESEAASQPAKLAEPAKPFPHIFEVRPCSKSGQMVYGMNKGPTEGKK